jgi:hypothetical protein
MLTIKHIRFDGAETIDYADRVIFYPSDNADQLNTPCPHWGGLITAVGAISGGVDWKSGVVYVMNDNGATIGKYDLGPHEKFDRPPVTEGALGVSTSA